MRLGLGLPPVRWWSLLPDVLSCGQRHPSTCAQFSRSSQAELEALRAATEDLQEQIRELQGRCANTQAPMLCGRLTARACEGMHTCTHGLQACLAGVGGWPGVKRRTGSAAGD